MGVSNRVTGRESGNDGRLGSLRNGHNNPSPNVGGTTPRMRIPSNISTRASRMNAGASRSNRGVIPERPGDAFLADDCFRSLRSSGSVHVASTLSAHRRLDTCGRVRGVAKRCAWRASAESAAPPSSVGSDAMRYDSQPRASRYLSTHGCDSGE